ncbi:serine phosphatase RsbU, regulator of sigma subunit [Beggiatoa alba B18LD]|uniref:Serine phosphatase RsbU, regulator of sigma subunit n=1 Tax=Beggiatoa alba B18LD TaxID=395493 RepID=I3CGT8_9GAMM|nr:SpoIIE family protein phosphatase [Beggiatoa alba]EIJ42831.1 serine phosphatase RsbU, regulator of sigma subunit [Beggiatoa alba B18LD]
MKIKKKLILTFIVLKIVPLIIIAFIATYSVYQLGNTFTKNGQALLTKTESVIQETASSTIADSIYALDQKSQVTQEQTTIRIAHNVAEFLYERDNDLLTLASLPINQNTLTQFQRLNTRDITVHGTYHFDNELKKWVTDTTPVIAENPITTKDILEENKRAFHKKNLPTFKKQRIPLYKEISFYNLQGQEQYKASSIDTHLKDISQRNQTYLKAETYYQEAQSLKQGEIYVSDVIGEYRRSPINGIFSPESAKAAGIAFEPEKYAYAGIENPVGKPFEGIIRFVTPVYDNNEKIGYLTLALDHRHLSEFTDYIMPDDRILSDISDASAGNYAFMWDYLGRCITHARDYFIVGFNAETGERVPPWITIETRQEWQQSGISSLNDFLATYPPFKNQSTQQTLDEEQKHRGEIALDCRYLNKAPQCHGWSQITEQGGYGSFIISWAGVLKFTTAASIPYFTGKYGKSARGFGFITIGANLDEFHKDATGIEKNIHTVLEQQSKTMQTFIETHEDKAIQQVHQTAFEVGLIAIILLGMVIVAAIMIANNFTQKIYQLILGAQAFANNHLGYRIPVQEDDEFGQLAIAFNNMSDQIQDLVVELEIKIEERTIELTAANAEITQLNQQLKQENTRMGAELAVTQKLQAMLTPKLVELAQIKELDVAGFMEPCHEVGGDYYDVLTHEEGLKIGVGDVTGHGLESGVVMLMLQTAIRTLVEHQESDPIKFINTINRTIYHNVKRMGSEQMSTLLLADYKQGILTVSGQHEEVIIVRADGTLETIDTLDLGFPIGLEENIESFVEKHPITLFKDDIVIFYTDGITEAENIQGEFYGTTRLAELVREVRQLSAVDICQCIVDDVKKHIAEHRVFDDITLLVMKHK